MKNFAGTCWRTSNRAPIMRPEPDALFSFVEEAITSLGYLKLESAPVMATLLPLCDTHHPNAVAAQYRKRGEQISRDEKKALGLRSNAFMSREAVVDLTEKGRERPLEAHATTLLRASFSAVRARSIASTPRDRYTTLRYDPPFRDCPACAALSGQSVPHESISPFPLDGCSREACPLTFRVHTDFIGQVLDRERASPASVNTDTPPRGLLSSFARLLKR